MDFTSREALTATLDLAPVSIIVADSQGRIVAWNRASQTLFGFPASEVIGQSLDVIIPEHLRDSHWKSYDRSLESGETTYAGHMMIAAGRDGTERFLAERARRMQAPPAA